MLITAFTYTAIDNVLIGVGNDLQRLLPRRCPTYRVRSRYQAAPDPVALGAALDAEVNRSTPGQNLANLLASLDSGTDLVVAGGPPEQVYNLLPHQRRADGTEDITIDLAAKAITTFERTIMSGNSPYDRYHAGQKNAMSPPQIRGLDVFLNNAKCDACHEGVNFTSNMYANLGVGADKPDPDAGNFAADLSPGSLEVLSGAMVEPALAADNAPEPVQFERQGYFCRDADSQPGKPVFNRTVGLRDTWAKVSAGGKKG